jgi:hypothetical protein
LNAEPPNYFAVTREDIKRVLQKYIVPARRTLVEVRPIGMADTPKTAPPAVRPAAQKMRPNDKSASRTGKGSHGKEIEGGRHKPHHKKEGP